MIASSFTRVDQSSLTSRRMPHTGSERVGRVVAGSPLDLSLTSPILDT